jgi:hypothetical protein
MTAPTVNAGEGAAGIIAGLLETHAALDLPVRLRTRDGSEAGPELAAGSAR